MTSLRRTAAGGYSLEDATPLETLIKDGPEKYLRGVDGLFKNMPKAVLSDKEEKKVRNGAAFETALPDGVYRVYGKEEFLAVCEAKAGKMKTVKSFFEV